MTEYKLPKVQAGEVTFELHSLGWKAFQSLCVTVVADVWGQVVQSFFDSHDAGRDGAFHGTWKSKNGESFQGAFTVQCKFTAKTDKSLMTLEKRYAQILKKLKISSNLRIASSIKRTVQ